MPQKILLLTLFISFSITPSTTAQIDADTLFYQIQPNMIQQVVVDHHWQRSEYIIDVTLKDSLHEKYEERTQQNIGHFLAITVDGKLLDPTLPTIQAAIPNGRFSLGPYKNEEQAQQIHEILVNGK